MKKIYIIMASIDKGKNWTICLDSDGGFLGDEFKHCTKNKMEEFYQKMKATCHRLKVPHIARKYFKIVEFSGEEEA